MRSASKETLPSQVFSIAQSLSQTILLRSEDVRPTFFCQICLGNVDELNRFSLHGCENELHSFCRSCLSGWLESLIKDGVTSIPCPMRGLENENNVPR